MARNEHKDDTVNTWTRTASLLISEAGSNEVAASRQALRRLFAPWEQQLLDTSKQPQVPPRPLATLICLRQLLTRFYQFRYEFDQASPPPNKLPVTMPTAPQFDTLRDDDGDFCVALIGTLPEQWLQAARKKFIVQEQHCQELEALLKRYFERDGIRAAINAQSEGLRSIAENLGHDSAVKAFQDDTLRKTLAPLAANKALDGDSFRTMLQQQRKNYDHLTIDGGGSRFSVEGCSFRHAHFRNIILEMEGCALHHTRFRSKSSIRYAHHCEFGTQATNLQIDALRGDYTNTHFDNAKINIVYPGSQLGHLSNCHIKELGGNVKHLENCHVDTLRGLCLKIDNCVVGRALRARLGSKINGLQCSEMIDCQFGQQVIEGIKLIRTLRGHSYSDLTFIDTTFDTIAADSTIFRLRGCRVRNLLGTIATLDHCRIGEMHTGSSLNKVISSQLGDISGGTLKLCGTYQENSALENSDTAPTAAADNTHIKRMTGGTIEHLNGVIEQFLGGKIKHLGDQRSLRLSKVKVHIETWQGGSIGTLDKPSFLKQEKALLLEETTRIGKAIRQQASRHRFNNIVNKS